MAMEQMILSSEPLTLHQMGSSKLGPPTFIPGQLVKCFIKKMAIVQMINLVKQLLALEILTETEKLISS